MQRLPFASLALVVSLLVPIGGAAAEPTFEKDILPIFQAKCLGCHGADKQKADLDMRSKAAMLRGGESGPSLQPGSAAKSLIWEKVAADKMPPGKEKLTADEKAVVRAWIDSGAKDTGIAVTPTDDGKDRSVTDADRQFWAFRPPVRPPVPAVKHGERIRNPIDAFLLAELEKKGLSYAAGGRPADAAAASVARPDRPAAVAARDRRLPRG